MGMFTESVEVTRAANGMPLRVKWKGADYRLVAEPECWFERRKWWDENLRIPRGIGAGVAEHGMWGLQLAPASGRGEARRGGGRFEPQSGLWRLVRVHYEMAQRA